MSCLSPFLKTGKTCARFQISGNIPLERETLNRWQRGLARMGAANLRIKFPTPSGPVALDIFNWVSTLRTCDFVRFMCVRREVVLYVNRGRSGPGGSWE